MHDESGAILVIALAVIAFVGLLGAALLNYATTNLKATSALRPVRGADYAADGAVEGAINILRRNPVSALCNGADGFYRAVPKLDDQEIAVACSKTTITSSPVKVRAVFTAKCAAPTSAACPTGVTVLTAQVLYDEPQPGVITTTVESWSAK